MLSDLTNYLPHIFYIIEGSLVTLKYSIFAVFFGLIIGIILAALKVSKHAILRIFADCYTSIFRGTPLLIQLSLVYFALPVLIGIKLSIFTAGVLAFSLNSGAYVSEIIRAGINSVDKGQFEAAWSLGISRYLTMKDIILPQAIRNIFPSLVNELINLLKESALISTLGEMDLMRRAQVVQADTFNYFAPMLSAAATYYVLVLLISSFGKIIEKRLAL